MLVWSGSKVFVKTRDGFPFFLRHLEFAEVEVLLDVDFRSALLARPTAEPIRSLGHLHKLFPDTVLKSRWERIENGLQAPWIAFC